VDSAGGRHGELRGKAEDAGAVHGQSALASYTEHNTNFNKSKSKRGYTMRYRTLVIVACLLLALVALSCGAKVRHSHVCVG
jgi:hypothetical protein